MKKYLLCLLLLSACSLFDTSKEEKEYYDTVTSMAKEFAKTNGIENQSCIVNQSFVIGGLSCSGLLDKRPVCFECHYYTNGHPSGCIFILKVVNE